jgi:hypothetical protein
MDFDRPDIGFGWLAHAFGAALYLLCAAVMFIVFIGLVFLLVRFLLVATKAAQLYVAQHTPNKPVTSAAASAKPTTTTAPTVPVTKTRPPKTP